MRFNFLVIVNLGMVLRGGFSTLQSLSRSSSEAFVVLRRLLSIELFGAHDGRMGSAVCVWHKDDQWYAVHFDKTSQDVELSNRSLIQASLSSKIRLISKTKMGLSETIKI